MTRNRGILLLLLCGCVLAGGVSVVGLARGNRLYATPRREWKDQAIARIDRRLSDEPAMKSMVERIGSAAATRPASDAWIGDDVLVMRNGDWIACENICRKEDARIHDLFIGRGSDSRWYYSTFHFCRDKVVLRMEDRQPTSLADFADVYWLAPFDGWSDECLNATWTGTEAWGQDKLQMNGVASSAR